MSFLYGYLRADLTGLFFNSVKDKGNDASITESSPRPILHYSFPSPAIFESYFLKSENGSRLLFQAASQGKSFLVDAASASDSNNNNLQDYGFIFAPICVGDSNQIFAVVVIGIHFDHTKTLESKQSCLELIDSIRSMVSPFLYSLYLSTQTTPSSNKRGRDSFDLDNLTEDDDSYEQTQTNKNQLLEIRHSRLIEKLHFSKTLLTSVLSTVHDVSVICTSPSGLIKYVSMPGTQRHLGYSPNELVGKASITLLHSPKELLERSTQLETELSQKLSGFEVLVEYTTRWKVPETRQWTFVTKAGKNLPVTITYKGLYSQSSQQVTGYLAAIRLQNGSTSK